MSGWYKIKLSLTSALVGAIVASGFWIIYLGGDTPTSVNLTASAPPKPVATSPVATAVSSAGSDLVIPVGGIRPNQLVDTFKQARDGGARPHDAIDIMAPHGTPVVAAAAGTLEKLFTSVAGGLTAYVRSPDRRTIYYYAHLQDYAPGLTEGAAIKRGQAIGTVGSTGNANPAGPHLHFAIHSARPDEAWHAGTALNPYPLLAGGERRR